MQCRCGCRTTGFGKNGGAGPGELADSVEASLPASMPGSAVVRMAEDGEVVICLKQLTRFLMGILAGYFFRSRDFYSKLQNFRIFQWLLVFYGR